MKHNQLLSYLKKYGSLNTIEEDLLKKYFIPYEVKKKAQLIEKNFPCDKLFFVNNGLIRAYHVNDNGREITRMIAGKDRFLTNIGSFRNSYINNETIECIQGGELLYISRNNFEFLVKKSLNLKSIYADILENYSALQCRRFQSLTTSDINQKITHLLEDFPEIISQVNDGLLASFLGVSREYFVKNKTLLYQVRH